MAMSRSEFATQENVLWRPEWPSFRFLRRIMRCGRQAGVKYSEFCADGFGGASGKCPMSHCCQFRVISVSHRADYPRRQLEDRLGALLIPNPDADRLCRAM